MKKIAIAALLSASLMSNSAFADTVVATYVDGNVTAEQVMEQFKPMLDTQVENKGKKFSDLDKNMQELLVKSYINQKLLEKEADRLNIRGTDEFKKKAKAAEDMIVQQELIERQTKDAITDKMVEEEYNVMSRNLKGQKEIKVSHILVDSEDKAKDLKKKINKGSKFDALAKENSNDEGSKVNGGELGYVLKGQLVPEFETKAFAMKKGEVSDPVKTQFGWHIIKVLDIRDVKIPTKEQAVNNIKAKLTNDAIKAYLTDLADKAKIEMKI